MAKKTKGITFTGSVLLSKSVHLSSFTEPVPFAQIEYRGITKEDAADFAEFVRAERPREVYRCDVSNQYIRLLAINNGTLSLDDAETIMNSFVDDLYAFAKNGGGSRTVSSERRNGNQQRLRIHRNLAGGQRRYTPQGE